MLTLGAGTGMVASVNMNPLLRAHISALQHPCRRKRYQLRHAALGLCVLCANEKHPRSVFCPRCLLGMRRRSREALGCKPWREGGKGKPPLDL